MSSQVSSARDGALAKLAAEAARFRAPPAPSSRADAPDDHTSPARSASPGSGPLARPKGPAGYVPVAVAPERGNTRPLVPVDGRLHMRIAQSTLDALDDVVRRWRADDPTGLRDLERATLVRVGLAMVLTDIAQNGMAGATAEAVRTALTVGVRHTDQPMPPLDRWLRRTPAPQGLAAIATGDPPAAAASD